MDGLLEFCADALHIVGVCGVTELPTEFANPVLHETTPPFGEERSDVGAKCSLPDELGKSGEACTFESKGNKPQAGSNHIGIINFATTRSPATSGRLQAFPDSQPVRNTVKS